jgi:precorrin-2/cobalt-factor-2 C20-methyltransferase
MKEGKVIGVGVGPGDAGLLTVKAVQILQEADVICAPTWHLSKPSLALTIVRPVLDNRQQAPQIMELVFPMVEDKTQLEKAWTENANVIAEKAQEGKLVAFVVIGDPSLYSTFTYVQRTFRSKYPEIKIEVIPGVTSPSACAAKAGMPLAIGRESLLIMPEFDGELARKVAGLVDNIVCMKVVNSFPQILRTLKESANFSDRSQVFIAKKCSFADERTWKGDMKDALQFQFSEDYFDLLMIRRKPKGD